jgi:hypothetical protein
MRLRDGLDTVAKRKIPCPCWELNTGRPARGLVTILTELSRLLLPGFDEATNIWCSKKFMNALNK